MMLMEPLLLHDAGLWTARTYHIGFGENGVRTGEKVARPPRKAVGEHLNDVADG